jgi:polyisoprenoid-binding protein YceI
MAWTTDQQHTSIEFAARHMVVSTVRGRFNDFSVDADIDVDDLPASRGTVTVKTASVDTREEQRDAHLRSPDFFDAQRYPDMVFTITDITGSGANYTMTGDLTIKDVTRPVTLKAEVTGPVSDPWGNTRLGLSAAGKLNRKDYGLTWNVVTEAGGLLVGDEVKIAVEAEFVQVASVPEGELAASGVDVDAR